MANPSVRFSIDGVPPNFSNQRMHWAKLAKEKATWRERAFYAGAAARVLAGWIAQDKATAELRQVAFELHRMRSLDIDGAWSSIKPCLDGLKANPPGRLGVSCGLIYDDSPQWCEVTVKQVPVHHYRQQRVVIEVTRREDIADS